jgi:hypothetical protein
VITITVTFDKFDIAFAVLSYAAEIREFGCDELAKKAVAPNALAWHVAFYRSTVQP